MDGYPLGESLGAEGGTKKGASNDNLDGNKGGNLEVYPLV